nr:unnamed protein product [Digitaria exilis]
MDGLDDGREAGSHQRCGGSPGPPCAHLASPRAHSIARRLATVTPRGVHSTLLSYQSHRIHSFDLAAAPPCSASTACGAPSSFFSARRTSLPPLLLHCRCNGEVLLLLRKRAPWRGSCSVSGEA